LYSFPLLKLGSAYLDAHTDDWYVLSAKYGLVHKDKRIAPYELTLNSMRTADVRVWAERVWSHLSPVLGDFDKVIFVAGERYRRFLLPRIEEFGIICEVPLERMGIGEQLSWLKNSRGA
jgi:hypothetical protein